MNEQRYPYRSGVWKLVLILTGVMTVVTVYLALFPVGGDRVVAPFVTVMGLMVIAMASFAGWAYLRERGSARAVVLGVDAISAPPNALSAQIVTIPYARITDSHILAMQNSTTLHVAAPDGSLGIPVGAVGDLETLNRILSELLDRTEKATSDA